MAIGVAYKVPAALLQAEKEKEERQFQRQLTLQKNQQKFQEKMANAAYARQLQMQDNAYARQLENRQYNADRQDALLKEQRDYNAQQQQIQWDRQDAQQQKLWDRQDALREDDRAYRQTQLEDQRDYAAGQQQLQWDRQDTLRRENADLDAAKLQYADQQRQALAADMAMTLEWQQSEAKRQVLEKNYTYSPEAQASLDRINREMHDLMDERDTIVPQDFNRALRELRMQKSAVMPDVPVVRPTLQEQFANDVLITTDGQGNEVWIQRDKKTGNWIREAPDKALQLSADTKAKIAADPNFDARQFQENTESINSVFGRRDVLDGKQSESKSKSKAKAEMDKRLPAFVRYQGDY